VIYRRELRPVITTGAEVMDQIFGRGPTPAVSDVTGSAFRASSCRPRSGGSADRPEPGCDSS
jgi:hypothetical protein